MKPAEALDIVRRVAAIREPPVWLICGVGVAFMAGRWTRDHGDVDFMAFSEDRAAVMDRFGAVGFEFEADRGWVVHWRSSGHLVELVLVDRTGPDVGDVVVCPDATLGGMIEVGRHPGVPGDMDPNRYASLDGVRIRVGSAAGEWALRRGYAAFRPEAELLPPKVVNDLGLLEPLVTPEQRAAAEAATGRVLPLRAGDCR